MGLLNRLHLRAGLLLLSLFGSMLAPSQTCRAQEGGGNKEGGAAGWTAHYERASLCMMSVVHPMSRFDNEIQFVFSRMKMPERFNSHNLGVRLVTFTGNNSMQENVDYFVKQTGLAKRMVAKWFNRDKRTGRMNMELIRERGLYNATAEDVNLAKAALRGQSLIEDAGEELIGHTYFIMNDITYIDKSVGWKVFKKALNITKNLADIWLSGTVRPDCDPFENPDLASINAMLDDIKSFRVNIKSYLYRLVWNDSVASVLYNRYYTPVGELEKKKAFEADQELFRMEYVGMVESSSSKTSIDGLSTNAQFVSKVCTRAVDKNIAKLQHEFEDFRIKSPISSVQPLRVSIGKKEDVSEQSRYEVLERLIDARGHTNYKRVGVVKPVRGRIWDNRCMAAEEAAEGAELGFTEFEKVSGGTFYPGMLIREIK